MWTFTRYQSGNQYTRFSMRDFFLSQKKYEVYETFLIIPHCFLLMTFRLCTLSLNSVPGVRIELSPQHSCCASPKTPKSHILIFEPSLMTTNLKMWPPGRLWLKGDKEVESKTETTWLHEVTTRTNDRWKWLNQSRVNTPIALITSSK